MWYTIFHVFGRIWAFFRGVIKAVLMQSWSFFGGFLIFSPRWVCFACTIALCRWPALSGPDT